jgi:hypothetical protein
MQLSLDQFIKYENKWVAFANSGQDRIVGSGDTLAEARNQAKQNGVAKPIFFKMLPDAYFIPAL